MGRSNVSLLQEKGINSEDKVLEANLSLPCINGQISHPSQSRVLKLQALIWLKRIILLSLGVVDIAISWCDRYCYHPSLQQQSPTLFPSPCDRCCYLLVLIVQAFQFS